MFDQPDELAATRVLVIGRFLLDSFVGGGLVGASILEPLIGARTVFDQCVGTELSPAVAGELMHTHAGDGDVVADHGGVGVLEYRCDG